MNKQDQSLSEPRQDAPENKPNSNARVATKNGIYFIISLLTSLDAIFALSYNRTTDDFYGRELAATVGRVLVARFTGLLESSVVKPRTNSSV